MKTAQQMMTAGMVEERDSRQGQVLANLGLFLAAPLIGLAYIVVFPLVGFAAIAKCIVQAGLR